MGKFDGILFYSDFDGTIAVGERISAENAEAVRYFQSEGGRFGIATGRTYRYFEGDRFGFHPNAPYITYNGAGVNDENTGAFLRIRYLDDRIMEDTAWALSQVDGITGAHIHNPCHGIVTERQPGEGEEALAERIRTEMGEGGLLKVLFCVDPARGHEIAETVRAHFAGRYTVSRSADVFVEILPHDGDKWAAVRAVRDLLSDVRETVCVGDYENDITMILGADRGYAMKNSVERLLAVAPRLTVDQHDHAIRAIVEDLERR